MTSVPVHISWDFSFHDFNEVSVLYSGLQIRNTFSFLEYMKVSKVPDVETQVCCLQNRCFPIWPLQWPPTERPLQDCMDIVVLLSQDSLTWEYLSLMLGAWVLPALLPAYAFFPCSLRCSSSVGVRDQRTPAGTYSTGPGHTDPHLQQTLSVAPGWPDNTCKT